MVEINEPQFKDKKQMESKLAERLKTRASRRLIGMRENKEENVKARMGLAFLGAIGWYVPLPTALGALAGHWLDKHYPQPTISWSLNLILLGLVIGILAAGHWLKREAIDHAVRQQKLREQQIEKIKKEADVIADEDINE